MQSREHETFSTSEIVIGLCGAVGTDLARVVEHLERRVALNNYTVQRVKISSEVIQSFFPPAPNDGSEFDRIIKFMDAGDLARQRHQNNEVLALGAIWRIQQSGMTDGDKKREAVPRRLIIVDSLKHPEEVERLRLVYPEGFYLLGVHADEERRKRHLVEDKNIAASDADHLMDRDQNDHQKHGQRVTDTFHLSDFFVRVDGDDDKLRNSITRLVDIIFAHPFKTPTFDEYAMFMAFSASLRSADLSRQVGAVIARDEMLIATGANDSPRFGGGLYWSQFNPQTKDIEDWENGRDYMRKHPKEMRGFDSNKFVQLEIVKGIADSAKEKFESRLHESDAVKKLSIKNGDTATLVDLLVEDLKSVLSESPIDDLTEFGRVVHAEMEAILSCARSNVSAKGSTLYGTTFPCHNCAKHIIAAGIARVVYIEPYEKSRAEQFHDDSVSFGFSHAENRVQFEPFVGVGPRRFFDLFSMKLGSGMPVKRKDPDGIALEWPKTASVPEARLQMYPGSYIDLELMAVKTFKHLISPE